MIAQKAASLSVSMLKPIFVTRLCKRLQRNYRFTLEKTASIGLNSGLYPTL